MARITQYTLYATGRIDPTFANVWGFNDATARTAFLNGCSPRPFLNQNYWRVGEPIKVDIEYGESFKYDYVMINNQREGEPVYYAFITSRGYASKNTTLLTLSIDYVQTFYFVNNSPWWACSGFIEMTTDPTLHPPRGTTSEFPVPESVCVNFQFEPRGYVMLVYASIDLKTVTSESWSWRVQSINGVYMSSPPYIISGTAQQIAQGATDLIQTLNQVGLTDAVAGMYIAPATYFADVHEAGKPDYITNDSFAVKTINITQPTACNGYEPVNKELLGYDYTYFTVNNAQGEVSVYHFEDFVGSPQFACEVSLTSGAPVLQCRPVNYVHQDVDAWRQQVQKINSPVSCTYLNDSYKIWLAQTQNSRQASINGAQLAIDEAKQIRNTSLSNALQGQASSLIGGVMDSIVDNGFLQMVTGSQPHGGASRKFGTSYGASSATLDNVNLTDSIRRNLTAGNVLQVGAGLAGAMAYKAMGLQEAAQLDYNVYRAQNNMSQLLAGYADKARVPPTAVGSNAYGDLTLFAQYGFMFAVYTPTHDWAEMIDKNLSAGGHRAMRSGTARKAHKTYDYYKIQSAYIPVDVNARPSYVRNIMTLLMQQGVYIWHADAGQISPRFGIPYDTPNEVI